MHAHARAHVHAHTRTHIHTFCFQDYIPLQNRRERERERERERVIEREKKRDCARYNRYVCFWHFLLCTNPQIINVEIVEKKKKKNTLINKQGHPHLPGLHVQCIELSPIHCCTISTQLRLCTCPPPIPHHNEVCKQWVAAGQLTNHEIQHHNSILTISTTGWQ